MAAERIIGIDFGTSTSFVKIKRYVDGKPLGGDRYETKNIVFDGKGSIALPTIVQQAGEQFWFGYEAEVPKPGGTIYSNFKINLESTDPSEQAIAEKMTEKFFQFFHDKYEEQSKFFGELDDTERTLVSYPAKWREKTRRFMVQAAQKAGFRNVSGMDEATAAIGAVMIQKAPSLQEKGYLQPGVPVTLLLIDMGAGTTDLALCRYTAGTQPKNEIIATWPKEDAKIFFGGREIDNLLCDFLTRQLVQNGMKESIVNSIKKLRMGEIKFWKEYTISDMLNNNGRVESCSVLDSLYMMMDMMPPPFPVVDRRSFEQMAHTYLCQYAELINGCIAGATKTSLGFKGAESVDFVILTGGHSQWYFAKDVLTGRLNNLGVVNLPQLKGNASRIIYLARPQETVSLGLAYSAMLPEIGTKIGPKTVPRVEPKVAPEVILVQNELYEENTVNKGADNSTVQYGNTCGNIENGGHVAQQGEWIYYHNFADNSKLYKIRSDGTEKTKLSDKMVKNINVLGEWIYFVEGESHEDLYKIHLDGSEETMLCSDGCEYVNIVDHWIYYANSSQNNRLYKIRTDGTDKTKLSDDSVDNINVLDNWIYYTSKSDGNKLYKVKTDGMGKVRLCDNKCCNINVYGGWIYYINSSDGSKIYKIRVDGTKNTKLNEDESRDLNVSGDWAYYCLGDFCSKYRNDNGYICKISLDGLKRMELCKNEQYEVIGVCGDWIYYLAGKTKDLWYILGTHLYMCKMKRMRTEGIDIQTIEKVNYDIW